VESGLIRDPLGVLDLPAGFAYHVVEVAGMPMDDGFRVPGRPDAMGCFDLGGGKWALMRNHELDRGSVAHSPYGSSAEVPDEAYDPRSLGGVTRVVVDKRGQRLTSNLVLTGTARNCAGGVSPWGWLSCEESVEPGHGYAFLCPISADRVQRPQRISAYGRFFHEGVAIDPRDHAAYLTEDRPDGCLYRFVPQDPAQPFDEGKLQALAVVGESRFDVARAMRAGRALEVCWVDLDPKRGDDDSLRDAAQDRGAAVVRRGEGIWMAEDGIFFTSTTGGPSSSGQVLHLAPTSEGGRLSLIYQSPDERVLDMPDNLTVTPWGDLLLCEDNARDAYLKLLTRAGRIVPFAHNAKSRSELAGVCFSPDARVLFVNIQEEGLTLAVQGPWERLRSS
jgi:secreted PhoX family phosphatase